MNHWRQLAALFALLLSVFILSGSTLAPEAGPVDVLVEAALEALSGHVTQTSDPEALRYAFTAYFNYRAKHPERVRKPYLYFVDYGLSNRTRRGYVFDMERLELVEGPFTVAHGSGSGPRYGTPTKFSNRSGSYMNSLGLYLAQETYDFSGRADGRRYTSIGLRLKGESGHFNSNARSRGIVAHGAPYVTSDDAGRSQGCPAMEQDRARRLLPKLANGGMVFLFSPHDRDWLENAQWFSR